MDRVSCLPSWLHIDSLLPVPVCSCAVGGGWRFHDRVCDRVARPYIDDETAALIESAVESLVCGRGSGIGDAGAALSCVTSLIIEALSRLPDAVADAREQDYSWDEIAARLATTASCARRRFGPYGRGRVPAAGEAG